MFAMAKLNKEATVARLETLMVPTGPKLRQYYTTDRMTTQPADRLEDSLAMG